MADLQLGTAGAAAQIEVPKGASGRNTVQAVVEGLGLMPGRSHQSPVRTDGTETVETQTEPDATQQNPAQEENTPTTQFDFEAHKDELIPVKVAGETVLRPLSEVVEGHMRKADYTRKTQELAEQRRALSEGISPQDRQLLELGRQVAANPEAREALQGVFGNNEPPDESTQIKQLEARLDEQERVAEATKQINALLVAHPEAESHLNDIVAEMRRTGSRDPISTWRAMDYANLPERLVEVAETERRRRADAATEQSVVNEPSGAASGVVSAEELPVRDSNGQALSGRDFVRNLLAKGAAA